MDAVTGRSYRPSGLRAGIIIGLALALLGVVVGTAAGAVTPFQLVVVKNSASEPIPVVGSVSVSNTPANQNVTVSNFPASQPVTVGNFPATQTVGGTVKLADVRVFNDFAHWSNGDQHTFTFNGLMHVTGVTVDNGGSDYSMEFKLVTTAGELEIHTGDGGFSRDFTAPVPATAVEIFCGNLVVDCDATLTVFGY